jgi:hypothetical protein
MALAVIEKITRKCHEIEQAHTQGMCGERAAPLPPKVNGPIICHYRYLKRHYRYLKRHFA